MSQAFLIAFLVFLEEEMRKQCRLIIERKSLQRTEKKANGKSGRALLRFKFFAPRWSSPNPPFFLDISPEMFKKQNLLGHFNVTCMLFCFPASYIPPQQPVPWRSYVGAAILGGGIGYTLAHLFKVKKYDTLYNCIHVKLALFKNCSDIFSTNLLCCAQALVTPSLR